MVNLTDTHAHIHMAPLCQDLEGVVARAAEAGVKRIVTVGVNAADSAVALETAHRFENVYAAVGVHPEDSSAYIDSDYDLLLKMAADEKVIAVGEIGIDFYRDYAPAAVQERVFRQMTELSKQVKKPVIIHNREADEACIRVLSDTLGSGKGFGGIFHCFSGSVDVINWALDNGFYISYAGQVTYKSAQNLRDTLKLVPLDRLFVETDCPYLAPVPKRGKTNEPAYTAFTADFVAGELGISTLQLAQQLETNFINLFGRGVCK